MSHPSPKGPSNLVIAWIALGCVILILIFYGFKTNPVPKATGVYVQISAPLLSGPKEETVHAPQTSE